MSIHLAAGIKAKIAVVTAVGVAAAYQPIRPMIVCGNSMSPTYQNHEVLLTTSPGSEIDRGDIVVLATEDGQIVKRVAFIGGDMVPQIKIGGSWTDLVAQELHTHTLQRIRADVRFAMVPEGYVYVLGDNRAQSMDSRVFGCFPISAIDRLVVNPEPFKTPRPYSSANLAHLSALRSK